MQWRNIIISISKNTQWDELWVFLWTDYNVMLPLTEKNTFTKNEITAATERSA